MKLSNILVFLFSVAVSSSSLADCPTELPIDQLVDCIRVEGAGQSYDEYKRETEELAKQISGNREKEYLKVNASQVVEATER